MRKNLPVLGALSALAMLAALPACSSTVTTVRLDSGKAFYTAQLAFKSAQQTVLAACTPPIRPAQCPAAIDLLHTGTQAEAAAFTAQQAGNSADLQRAIVTLTNLPAQLVALGILKAN